jgi:ABC-type glycerol-3-phosphate transport system substrate-binding protein
VLAINARVGTNERRAALEFLRFMIGEEAQRELLKSDIQPARKDLKLEGDDLDKLQIAAAQAFRSQAEQGQPMPNLPTRERDLLRRELERMQQQVLLGEATPADAVTETDKRLRELLGISDQ